MRLRPITPLSRVHHQRHVNVHGGFGGGFHDGAGGLDDLICGAVFDLEEQFVMDLEEHFGGQA